jgi:hypothetical protein
MSVYGRAGDQVQRLVVTGTYHSDSPCVTVTLEHLFLA